MTSAQKSFKRKLTGFTIVSLFLVFAVFGLGTIKAVAQDAGHASDASQTETGKNMDPEVVKFAFLAAAIAVGVGAIGGGAAVGYVGAAAMGAIGEKPELAIRALLFVGLAEGIAIYGLIIAIMILGKV